MLLLSLIIFCCRRIEIISCFLIFDLVILNFNKVKHSLASSQRCWYNWGHPGGGGGGVEHMSGSVMFADSLVNTGYCTVQGNPYSGFNCDQVNTLTLLSGYSFQTMNTASKNCKCEVDEDFGLFPNLVTGYMLKTLLKGDVVLYWEEGDWGGHYHFVLCFDILLH